MNSYGSYGRSWMEELIGISVITYFSMCLLKYEYVFKNLARIHRVALNHMKAVLYAS